MALIHIDLEADTVIQAMGADAQFAFELWRALFEALDDGAVFDDFADIFREHPAGPAVAGTLEKMREAIQPYETASKPYDPTFHPCERSIYPLWRFAKSEYKAEVIAAYKAGKVIERAPSKGSTLGQWIEMRHANFDVNEVYRVRPEQ